MRFSKLFLNRWRQFESVEIDFHPRLTIITGANGTGKVRYYELYPNILGGRFRFLPPLPTKEAPYITSQACLTGF
jgi:predicted ATP-binding protein involved in virulence